MSTPFLDSFLREISKLASQGSVAQAPAARGHLGTSVTLKAGRPQFYTVHERDGQSRAYAIGGSASPEVLRAVALKSRQGWDGTQRQKTAEDRSPGKRLLIGAGEGALLGGALGTAAVGAQALGRHKILRGATIRKNLGPSLKRTMGLTVPAAALLSALQGRRSHGTEEGAMRRNFYLGAMLGAASRGGNLVHVSNVTPAALGALAGSVSGVAMHRGLKAVEGRRRGE